MDHYLTKRLRKCLRYLRDPLTGCFTRAVLEVPGFIKREEARSKRREVWVLFIDVDGLKRINDELGHEAGDRVLAHMGKALLSCLRGEDLIIRWGGDEFVVILTCPSEALPSVVSRLRNSCTPAPFGCTVSVGIAKMEGDFLEAVKKADKRMYEEKRKAKALSPESQ